MRVAGVKTYLCELGIASRAKRRRDKGSDGRLWGFIVGGDLELKKPMMPDMLVLDDDGDGEDGAGACQRGAVVSDGRLGLARRVRWAMSVSPKSPRAKVWLDRSERPRGWQWWAMPQIPACQGLARWVKGASWLVMADWA